MSARALDRKLMRDLWRLRGQIAAISVVVGAGIALFIASIGCMESLRLSRDSFYERYRFAEVFAELKRAPNTLADRIRLIPGIASIETRVVVDVTLDLLDMPDPATGRLISLPDHRPLNLNQVALQAGRLVSPGQASEVLVTQAFASAHKITVGDRLYALINGRKRPLDIVGVVLTPEYVYSLAPGQVMPDNLRFGVFWMSEKALAAAFDMEDGFNSVAVSLSHGADVRSVLDRLDGVLRPFGGFGAYQRADQVSHFFLENELRQLQTTGTLVPPFFLFVAGFLVNVVITRLVTSEREQIGLLKAFGYSDLEVGWHYLKLVLLIAGLGFLLGLAGGAWLGHVMTSLYTDFFKFPVLKYRIPEEVVLAGAGTALLAAVVGASGGVLKATRLSPAVAMAPPLPTTYRHGLISRFVARFRISQPARMIFRHVVRWPLRTGLTVLGIGLSVGLLVAAMFFLDSVERVIEVYFFKAERQTLTVNFVEPRAAGAELAFRRLPGVLATQPARTVAVQLSAGARTKRTSIRGIPEQADLSRILDADMAPVVPPSGGLVLSRHIAEQLGVHLGDDITVEVRQERRPIVQLPVTLLVDEYLGFSAYMSMPALHRLMGEGPMVSGIHVLADPVYKAQLFDRLKNMPVVAGIAQSDAALRSFRENMDRTMYVMIGFYVGFAAIIAFGVAYNSARIAFSERVRALASLQVLGFSSAEVSYILLGELAIQTLLALPLGCLLGNIIAHLLAPMLRSDMYSFPLVINRATYGAAMLVAVCAALACAVPVFRKTFHLNLVTVLKTRE